MKALTFEGPDRRVWHDVADPVIVDSEDAIVHVDAVTICGTDLHILKGDVPEVKPGRVLGHEAMGTIEQVGPAVVGFVPGDRVLISCITGCGRCRYCRENHDGQCLAGGGWVLGHLIDGTQAERVRVPFANRALHRLSDSVSDEQALVLADIMPTAYEVGVLNGQVAPGSSVAIVGAGPIGLAAVLTARLLSPSRIVVVDPASERRAAALRFGADQAVATADEAREVARDVDTAIEAVGVPETFELCTELVRAGGTVANVGVHGAPATLHLESLWIRNVTVRTGLVDTFSTPTLLRLIAEGRLDTEGLITHRFGLDEIQDAYDIFSRPQESGALKVALFNQ
ncbi:alcohol dehydrogenase catalytic domain-containing protein [Nocardioides pyridinolyticus]